MERFADLNEEEKKKKIFGAALSECHDILVDIAESIVNNEKDLEKVREIVFMNIDMIIYMNNAYGKLDPKILIPRFFHNLLNEYVLPN